MVKFLTYGLWLVALVLIGAIGFRTRKNYQKKVGRANVFAVQNVRNRMNLRPLNAGLEDGAWIILYKHANWECMTWEFIHLEDGSLLLRNVFTEKSWHPVADPAPGVQLAQVPLGGVRYQGVLMEKLPDGTCLLRLQGTNLYLTPGSDEVNAPVVLMQKDGTDRQRWRLVPQRPII